MPAKNKQFIGRKNELAQFRQILSQRGLQTESRVILIQGFDGIGKTALARSCVELAKKARWQTVMVNWAQNIPHTPTELLSILIDAIWPVIGEQQIKFLEEVVTRIETFKDTVQRFKQDHPEIWQKMLTAGENDSDQVPASLRPDLTDGSQVAQQRLISYMLQQNLFPKRLDELVLRDPASKLAQALVDSMAKGVGRRGIVVWLDACEVLPIDMEIFLRDAIICPITQKNAKLHFIISGSTNQFQERDVIDPLGNHHRVKGYGDRLYAPPPLVWQVQRMVDPEVKEFLKSRGLDNDEAAIETVKRLSFGVPLMAELISDAIKQQGTQQVQAIFEGVGKDAENIEAVIGGIVQRFVENYRDPTEIQMLYALALLLTPNDAALTAVCSLSEDDTPGPIMQKLSDTYTFITPDGHLHEVIRVTLRRYLRTNTPEYAQFLGHNAAIHFQTLIKNLTFQQVEERVNDQRWQSVMVNLINALCWTDEARALRLLAGSILEGEVFKPAFGQNMLTLSSEFRHAPAFWSAESCQLWDTLAKLVNPDHKIRITAYENIAEISSTLQLSEIHLSLLNILLAQLYFIEGQAEKAIELCDTVNENTLQDHSIARIVASAYSDAGTVLGFQAGEAVASDSALHAFKRANELESQTAASQYGLGSVLAAFNLLEEATETFSKALNLNPKHANSTYRRGLARYNLGKYAAARDDFTQSLNLNPKHAKAFYFRGITYKQLGDSQKALADFSKAISLEMTMKEAYTKRGGIYADLGQYQQAMEDFAKALTIDPNIEEPYTRRGETYLKLKQYDNAIRDFTQSLAHNAGLADVYAKRGYSYAAMDLHNAALEDYSKSLDLDPTISDVYIMRGDSYTALGEFERALADYSQALLLNNQLAQAYAKRAAILTKLGQLENALADYENALELNPKQPDAIAGRGSINLALEHYENAIADFNQAQVQNPQLVDIEAQRGLAYLRTMQYAQALVDFNRTIARNPNNAQNLYHRGLAHFHLERYGEALADFNQTLALNPQLVEVYMYRADTQLRLGKPEQALIDYGQAIAAEPQNATSYYNRGSIYLDLGQYNEALNDFKQAITLNPTVADAYSKRGVCYDNLNQTDKALLDYNHAIKLNPRDALVYNNRGNTYARLGEKENALLDFTQAITRNPEFAEAYSNRGNIFADLGQFDSAIADFSQALALNSLMPEIYYNRGNAYAQLGQLENALSDFNQVIANNPQDTATLNNRGNIHADLGQPELALADYALALELNPQLAEVYTNRGLTYADLGQYDNALTDYAHALAFDSNDVTAIYYSACVFALQQDESQACAWLEQAILQDVSYRTMAEEDPDFDNVRNASCFLKLMHGEL